MAHSIDIKVEFTYGPYKRARGIGQVLMINSGGLELLFSNKRKHLVTVPAHESSGSPVTVAHLITYLCDHLMQSEKKEMFVLDGSVYVLEPHGCYEFILTDHQTPRHSGINQRCRLGTRRRRQVRTSEQGRDRVCVDTPWWISFYPAISILVPSNSRPWRSSSAHAYTR